MASKAIYLAVTFIFASMVASSSGMVVISAGDLPGPSNECARGPEHWCSNIATAKACHATKHCIQTVWERQAVPEDHDSICDICKEMVQEARDQLQSNETQEELKEVFEGSCKLMPIKMVRMNCIKMVDDFIPELIEMLSSQMNPTMVCTTALLCNNALSDTLQAEYKAARLVGSSSANPKCGTCQAFMSRNADRIQSASLDQVQDVLFNVCDRTNSYSDGCKAIVADNMDKIYEYLSSSVRTEACKPLGYCEEPSEKQPIRVSVMPKSNDRKWRSKFESASALTDDMECDFCQALVKNVRNILVSNTTEGEFIQVLNGLCKQTGSYAKECQSLVAEYADVLYDFLMKELDPNQACQLLTLCPYKSGLKGVPSRGSSSPFYLRVEPSNVIQASKMVPAKRISTNHRREDILVGQDEANALASSNLKASDFVLPAQLLVPAMPMAPRKPTCILCEYVLNQILEDLKNTTVQEEIEDAVKNVCNKLPVSVKEECGKLVDSYGQALIFLLSQELDPSTMCVQLEMCDATGGTPTQVSLPVDPFKSDSDDPNTCALCEFVMTTLDKRLEDNRTEESLKEALENVCAHMPTTVRKDCKRLVDAYAKQIIEALLADLTPDEICTALKFCSPKVSPKAASGELTLREFLKKVKKEDEGSAHPAGSLGEFMGKMKAAGLAVQSDKKKAVKQWTSPKAEKNTPICVMCEFAMAALEKEFITNKTTDDMKRAVDFVCAHLPNTVADMCIDFVEQYGDGILQLLLSEVAPKAVCSQMGLCFPVSSVDTAVPAVRLLGHKNEHQNEEEEHLLGMASKCEICEMIIEYLDKLLEDDTVEESIDRIIERACVVIPHGVRDKCTEMVDTYGPYLLAQIGELMNKTKTCQSLHLCKPPPGNVQLLGGKQCTWGPTYWCNSLEHADACNALLHCQTKVWMKAQP